jgi:hypothetical protein
VVLTLLPFVLLLAAAWYFVWNRWSGEPQHPIERAFTALAGLLDLIAHYRKPPTSVPFFDVTIALLVLLFALALFALMVVVALAVADAGGVHADDARAGCRAGRARPAADHPLRARAVQRPTDRRRSP